jgi:hypothetical protein
LRTPFQVKKRNIIFDRVSKITGIAAGAKDWKVWIGSEAVAAAADSKQALRVGADMSVTGRYLVAIKRSFEIFQGNAKNGKLMHAFDLGKYNIADYCICQ